MSEIEKERTTWPRLRIRERSVRNSAFVRERDVTSLASCCLCSKEMLLAFGAAYASPIDTLAVLRQEL